MLIIYLRQIIDQTNFCGVRDWAVGRAEYSFVVSEAAEPKAVKTWPVAASPSPTLVTLNSFHADFSSHLSTAEELDSLMSRLTLCSSHTCVTGLSRGQLGVFSLTLISGQIAILEKGRQCNATQPTTKEEANMSVSREFSKLNLI